MVAALKRNLDKIFRDVKVAKSQARAFVTQTVVISKRFLGERSMKLRIETENFAYYSKCAEWSLA